VIFHICESFSAKKRQGNAQFLLFFYALKVRTPLRINFFFVVFFVVSFVLTTMIKKRVVVFSFFCFFHAFSKRSKSLSERKRELKEN